MTGAKIVRCSVLLLVVGLALGCGGPRKPSEAAGGMDSKRSVGEQCLADADARYQPRADAPNRIDIEHILIRHAGVANPGEVTRTPEEACLRGLEAWQKLQDGADWDAIAEEYSEARGAAGGRLSRVSAEELDDDFAAVAFSLEENELSYVVKTKRGFHLILRR